MTRPRAADDFTTIRARLEELRRERAQALRDPREPEEGAPGNRGLLRTSEARQRAENDRAPLLSSNRRYGPGR